MNPINWLDNQLLKLFDVSAKKFHSLTDKDNFFLAKTVVLVWSLIDIAAGLPISAVALVSVFLFYSIYFCEVKAQREIRDEASDTAIRERRRGLFLCRVFADAVFIFSLGKYIRWQEGGLDMLQLAGFLTTAYLLSLDPPASYKDRVLKETKEPA